MVTSLAHFHDEKLQQKSGLYYENRGTVNIVTTNWDLTIFIDLKKYNEQWNFIEFLLFKTEQACGKITREGGITCKNLATLVYNIMNQAAEKKNVLFYSIGHTDHKNKRSINFSKLTNFAQTLYGLCDFNCITKFDFGISKLLRGNQSNIKIDKERLKIVKIRQENENRELANLHAQLDEVQNITIEQQANDFINKHFTHMNLLLTQHMTEIDKLSTIIDNAKIGQIHPYLLGQNDLLTQFQDIRLSLPTGTDFPYELTTMTVNDILKLSDVKVYYSNNNIVFVLTIPLIYQNNFILYNLIPKPYCTNDMNCIYIAPSYKFIAISKNKEHYVAYDDFHYSQCKHARG